MSAREGEEVRELVAEKRSLGENARNGRWLTLKLTWENAGPTFRHKSRFLGWRKWGSPSHPKSYHFPIDLDFHTLNITSFNSTEAALIQLFSPYLIYNYKTYTKVAECPGQGFTMAKFRARLT